MPITTTRDYTKILEILSGGTVIPGTTVGAGGLGLRVVRAADADPQNVWEAIFTIAGGIIAVTGLYGVRTVIQAGGASTMQFQHDVAGVMDDGTLIVTGDTVGTVYSLTGNVAGPIVHGIGGLIVEGGKVVATSATYGTIPLFILGAGDIEVTMTAAAGTGSTEYALTYIPLDDDVTVVAA